MENASIGQPYFLSVPSSFLALSFLGGLCTASSASFLFLPLLLHLLLFFKDVIKPRFSFIEVEYDFCLVMVYGLISC